VKVNPISAHILVLASARSVAPVHRVLGQPVEAVAESSMLAPCGESGLRGLDPGDLGSQRWLCEPLFSLNTGLSLDDISAFMSDLKEVAYESPCCPLCSRLN
jgi:hypothetical protein